MTPTVTFVCVTENRPEFMPWLLWNYERIDWPRKELVIVDSSSAPCDAPVKVIHAPNHNIPQKRNIGLKHANGDFLFWIDDDDWIHPNRIKYLINKIEDRPCVGFGLSWRVNLNTGECFKHKSYRNYHVFSGALYKRDQIRVTFDESVEVASDSKWLFDLRFTSGLPKILNEEMLFLLCHGKNISNPALKWNMSFSYPQAHLEQLAGSYWNDTSAQLDDLRERIAQG